VIKTRKLGAFSIRFTHGHFLVYDTSVADPQCVWTKGHCQQGFARRESTACFSTVLDDGEASVVAYSGAFQDDSKYQRVVAVPFFTPGGRVIVSGVLEIYCARLVFVPQGHYLLHCGQWLPDNAVEDEDDHQFIDLFFQKVDTPAVQSRIILADEALHPPDPLLEDADVMA
jgi:hypothetical protein